MSLYEHSGELHFAIDRLVVSGRRVFGWGWAAHRSRSIASITLELEGQGWRSSLPAGIGHSREDVHHEHPDLVDARTSGFLLTGFAAGDQPTSVKLNILLADGTRCLMDVAQALEDLHLGKERGRRLRWIWQAVWRRLKRGDFTGIVRRARAQRYLAPSLDDRNALDGLLSELRRASSVSIVLDNNMGGGSNQYRRSIVAERVAKDQTVLLCTYNLPILEYRLHVHAPGAAERVFSIRSFLALDQVLRSASVAEVFVNSPVSFDEPLVLAEWLARIPAEHPGTRLTLTAHDFFAVCPSFVLLNADGRFCGIPDTATCQQCLSRHSSSFVALSPPSQIGPWRSLWGRALEAAHEVRCFSQSTRDLLLRAYPDLDPARVTVIPHRVDYVPRRKPRMDHAAPLVVGIVGEITFQKGASIVQDLVNLLDETRSDVKLVVIGALDAVHRSDRLVVTGPYKREDLVELIEKHGVNMLLFPSIWPETFSYVVAELAQLDAPIVAFDLGAPAERLRGQPWARLCRDISAQAALRTVVAFHEELAAPKALSA
jgi:glycosyltransferase involved in cell wall biosynthesis